MFLEEASAGLGLQHVGVERVIVLYLLGGELILVLTVGPAQPQTEGSC